MTAILWFLISSFPGARNRLEISESLFFFRYEVNSEVVNSDRSWLELNVSTI